MKQLVRPYISSARKPAVVPPPAVHPSGKGMINLTLGDPSRVDPKCFATPEHIRLARASAAYHGEYLPPRGHPRLLNLISGETGAALDSIAITNGASEAMEKLLLALHGQILMPSPCFPPYLEHHDYHGKSLLLYQTLGGLDIDGLERKITADTVAILVINPSNPTGMACDRTTLEAILGIAKRHKLLLVADEVYNELSFSHKPPRLRELTDEVPILELGSFSKRFLMCGDRVGWIAFHNMNERLAELRDALFRLCTTRLSANAPGQLAAIAALSNGDGHLKDMIAELKQRSRVMIDCLRNISGVNIVQPQAGFYLWFGLPAGRFSSDTEFVQKLAEDEAVYILPGSGFTRDDSNNGTFWFRAVFLPPVDVIREGVERIKRFVTPA